ncbi:protein of unknown function [Alicyclobacillus hesperidum]|uniref:DUF4258 domain-containing protein n=1 Tax=Alicyclobacillus hesperidum TaxID=89784 RepID=A0A1H2XX69_9BACL|nr:DUF4258 domain-containing protein [Alicyclobacillus hesperidum]SDW97562.1 protein of unknown function [Alicyclobacillus hesperidum]
MLSQRWQHLWDELSDILARQLIQKRVRWSDHAKEQMCDRNISKQSVQYVVTRNVANEMYGAYEYPHGPHPYANPDPVFSITGKDVSGRWVTVAVAVQNRNGKISFTIVTVLEPSPHSRHRKQP